MVIRCALLLLGSTSLSPPTLNNLGIVDLLPPHWLISDLIDEVQHSLLSQRYSRRREEIGNGMREASAVFDSIVPYGHLLEGKAEAWSLGGHDPQCRA
jgi:hypothetical protein